MQTNTYLPFYTGIIFAVNIIMYNYILRNASPTLVTISDYCRLVIEMAR